jgi:uncharacterized protein
MWSLQKEVSVRASTLPILKSDEVTSSDPCKPSRYNYFVEKADVVWGINFRSMAFIRLTPEQYRHMEPLLAGGAPTSDYQQSLHQELLKGKFLIPASLDELEQMRTRNWTSRFANNGLALIIAPTLRCNFTCEYCYVDLNANKMTLEDRTKLAKFVEKKLPNNTPMSVVWTGGDPSLAMDVVEDLSLRFHEICANKDSRYRASLITNGFLLNDEMREHMRKSKLSYLQVSLDGSREFHDTSRCLPNKKPTFDTILSNIDQTCDEFDIYLRINVDAKNHSKIPDLLDQLESRELNQRVFIYFAHLDDVNENSTRYHESCLTVREYANIEASLMRLAKERGFRLAGRILTSKPLHTFCGANSANYYVVDSKVNLLKCYNDFGTADKNGIGRIGEDGTEVVTNPYNLLKWLGWDPFSIPECHDCKLLPICMGGCSHKIMNSGMNVDGGCIKLRFSVEQVIDMFGEALAKQRGVSSGCQGCSATAISNV